MLPADGGGQLQAGGPRSTTPRLAELEREADRLAGQDGALAERAMVAAMLAMMHAVRCHQRSAEPAACRASRRRRLHGADRGDRVGHRAAQPGTPPGLPDVTLQRPGGAAARAGRHAAGRPLSARHPAPASLLARARAHFGQLPAEMLDQLPVFRDLSVLEQLIEGVVSPDDPAVESVTDRNPEPMGPERRRPAARQARRQPGPAQPGTSGHRRRAHGTADGLDRAGRGQPDARPGAGLDGHDAEPAGRADRRGQSASDAASTAIEAVRAATAPGEVHAAAQLLVTTFALMLSRGQRARTVPGGGGGAAARPWPTATRRTGRCGRPC